MNQGWVEHIHNVLFKSEFGMEMILWCAGEGRNVISKVNEVAFAKGKVCSIYDNMENINSI